MTTSDTGKPDESTRNLNPDLKIGKPYPLDTPEGYIPEPGLLAAIEIALQLGEPLLLSGEPGTGKTSVAQWIAKQLSLEIVPPFTTSSVSIASDLFYSYNALGHYHASRDQSKTVEARNFIAYQALGKAIILSNRYENVKGWLPDLDREKFEKRGGEPKRTVVLIDEIDKAPRDFPNDILNQIEQGYFRVPEIGPQAEITMGSNCRPIVVITSNSEKNLPDAFLRRCIYYDIPFPERDKKHILERIVAARISALKDDAVFRKGFIAEALNFFYDLRSSKVRLDRAPATAELLNWLLYMVVKKWMEKPEDSLYGTRVRDEMPASFSILAKTKNDLREMQRFYNEQCK